MEELELIAMTDILPQTRRCLNCKRRFPVFEHCEKRQFCTRDCSREYEHVVAENKLHPTREARCTPS